jgi:hypothetical protein
MGEGNIHCPRQLGSSVDLQVLNRMKQPRDRERLLDKRESPLQDLVTPGFIIEITAPQQN